MKKNNANILKTALALLLCLAGAVLIWLSVKYSSQNSDASVVIRTAAQTLRYS